jgi:hypothetical protein
LRRITNKVQQGNISNIYLDVILLASSLSPVSPVFGYTRNNIFYLAVTNSPTKEAPISKGTFFKSISRCETLSLHDLVSIVVNIIFQGRGRYHHEANNTYIEYILNHGNLKNTDKQDLKNYSNDELLALNNLIINKYNVYDKVAICNLIKDKLIAIGHYFNLDS